MKETRYVDPRGVMWIARRFMDENSSVLAKLQYAELAERYGRQPMYVAVIARKDRQTLRDDRSLNAYVSDHSEERAVAKAQLALDAYDSDGETYEILVGQLTAAILAPVRYMKRFI